jgi:dimethylargininase
MLTAITREVSSSINRCELTHSPREPISLDLARQQHRAYEDTLARFGCEIVRLPEEPDLPDAVFVEDTAVVLGDLAIITRPGAESRRAETESVAEVLRTYRELAYIEEPGTLDGGDVLHVGARVYVGLSERTNRAGAEQLRRLLLPKGYAVTPVEVQDCLHLKSSAALVTACILLVNPDCVDVDAFSGLSFITVDPAEPRAATALRIGGDVICPAHNPRTVEKLLEHRIRVTTVDVSELAKAEAGVTCMSIILTG